MCRWRRTEARPSLVASKRADLDPAARLRLEGSTAAHDRAPPQLLLLLLLLLLCTSTAPTGPTEAIYVVAAIRLRSIREIDQRRADKEGGGNCNRPACFGSRRWLRRFPRRPASGSCGIGYVGNQGCV